MAAHGGPVAEFARGIERALRRVDDPARAMVGLLIINGKHTAAVRAGQGWAVLTDRGVARIKHAEVAAMWGE
jgi:hypothetical protein